MVLHVVLLVAIVFPGSTVVNVDKWLRKRRSSLWNLTNEKVIFSIDRVSDLHTLSKFTRYLDNLRAMEKLKGDVVQCIGRFNNEYELSWIVCRQDFDEHILGTDWVDNQECFLHLPGSPIEKCWLYYQHDKTKKEIGNQWWSTLCPVGEDFTYSLPDKMYLTVK